jgi:hypothetical protein
VEFGGSWRTERMTFGCFRLIDNAFFPKKPLPYIQMVQLSELTQSAPVEADISMIPLMAIVPSDFIPG